MYLPWSTNRTPYVYTNITDMEKAVREKGLDNERVVVFLSTTSSEASMFEIVYENGETRRNTLKTYDSPAFTTVGGLAAILNDVKSFAPARSYAMTIGCHGMGWLPVHGSRKSRSAESFKPHWEYDNAWATRYFGGASSAYQTDISTLAESLERAGMPMDEFLDREFYRPMGLTHTCYRPLERLPRRIIIPSSVDPFLRKDTLQGFVHDESAAFLGGVSGNAGLFSNAHEQALLYQMLLNGGELNGRRYLSPETCRVFTTTLSRTSRRGLGFDKPDRRNPRRSPCCEEAPASVYGHTGFTGTCAWVDPDNHLVYIFLSNRIFPEVWNNKLSRLDIRTRIQQAVYKALK